MIVDKNGGFWVLLLLLIYSSSLTRLHNLGQYRVNEEEGVKLRTQSFLPNYQSNYQSNCLVSNDVNW